MSNHTRKMIAPVIITICTVLYYIGIAVLFTVVDDMPGIIKAFLLIVMLLLSGVMVAVLMSRIKEIRSGEEDDLSKY
ncbi:MAG: hypothetical protein Q4D16_21810 [Eubacteriales bacterium]|nr:hypothetical protein [Eubacteriales bacterium]